MSLRRVSKTTHTVPEEKQHLTRAEQLLSLEQIDPYLFRGFTPKTYFNRRIYGGQTIAQSLMAAYMTVGPEYVCVCVCDIIMCECVASACGYVCTFTCSDMWQTPSTGSLCAEESWTSLFCTT
jgi:hypothetical protein